MLVNEIRWWVRDRSDGFDSSIWPWVLACTVTLLLVAAMPFLAWSRALEQTGWVDADGDGMLDGFTNGGYDLLDVNGGPFVRMLLVGVVVVAALFSTAAWLIQRQQDSPSQSKESG